MEYMKQIMIGMGKDDSYTDLNELSYEKKHGNCSIPI